MGLVGGMFQVELNWLFFTSCQLFSPWYFFGVESKWRNPIQQGNPVTQGWSLLCSHPRYPSAA